MPPSSVHFNGSVNLPDAETVMREISARIPMGVRRMTDGETGERNYWIQLPDPEVPADARVRDGQRPAGPTRPIADAPDDARLRLAEGASADTHRLAQPRLCRRVREVVRHLRPAAAGRHDPGRRAPAAAVPDAAGLDGRHDRARGPARGRARVRSRRCSPTSTPCSSACPTTGSPSSGTSRWSWAPWRARWA